MGYGIEVKNSSGNVIIDGTYKNFSLYESGSVALSAQTVATITFTTSTTQIPLIAIIPGTESCVSLLGYTKSGDNYTGFKLIAQAAQTVYWKAYIAHFATATESYGMLVYDGDGAIVFDSGRDYFKIYDVETGITIDGPSTEGEGGNTTISHGGISDPYYVLSPLGHWVMSTTAPPGHHWAWSIGIKKINATSVKIGWSLNDEGASWGNANVGYNPTMSLVILT